MLNVWCGQGRLIKDVELHYTGDIAVTTITIAVDRDYKTREGEREADFIDVVAWRNLAEFVAKWFAKGDVIVVEGRVQTRLYEDRNGNKRKAVEIVANRLNFAGNRAKTDGGEVKEDVLGDLPEGITSDDLPF